MGNPFTLDCPDGQLLSGVSLFADPSGPINGLRLVCRAVLSVGLGIDGLYGELSAEQATDWLGVQTGLPFQVGCQPGELARTVTVVAADFGQGALQRIGLECVTVFRNQARSVPPVGLSASNPVTVPLGCPIGRAPVGVSGHYGSHVSQTAVALPLSSPRLSGNGRAAPGAEPGAALHHRRVTGPLTSNR
ncbi:MAG: hypothetical protein KatS3mg121_1531 [Gammaproteobacteria bacterium]|nr:MAG: hypothetical protein KatS3mg121_1531 [Gammaproteobacteria bacterium]